MVRPERFELAHLPVQEFALYWNEIDYKTKHVDRTWISVRESREKHGWKEIERDKELPLNWQPNTIKNKYFSAQHYPIS